jgi:tetratricopeptide (TPR) repeat protein
LTENLKKIEPDKDTCEVISFLSHLAILIEAITSLAHFLHVGVPLGGRLKLLQPRNSNVRTDKPIFLKFTHAIDKKFINSNFNYEISIKEVDGGIIWGPFKVSKEIDPETDIVVSNSKKYLLISHLFDNKNLEPYKEYQWIVGTEDYIRSSFFRILDANSLEILEQVEKQVKELKNINSNEKDFLLGALYEQLGLFEDATAKYKSVIENDPSLIIALPRLSAVYAKKASKSFTREVDFRKLSRSDINRDDLDLALEADNWTKCWKDSFNQVILDLSRESGMVKEY